MGALGNYVASDFGMTPAQKGLMAALPLLGGSFLRCVLGYLTDTWGARKAGLMGLSFTLLPLLGGWLWADSLDKIFAVAILLGVAGASFAVALPMVSRWYPREHQGLALGIAGAGNSGTILATLFGPRLAEVYGWHRVFGMAIIPLLAVTAIFFALAKDAPNRSKGSNFRQYLQLFREKDIYSFGFFYAVTFGGFVGLASYLSIFLRDQYGISKVAAGDLTSICVVAGSFMRPLGGFLSDRLGGIRLLGLLYASVTVLAFILAKLPPIAFTVPLFFLMMGCLGMSNGAVFQLVPQRFAKNVGIATGILGAAGGLGGFFLPTLLGWFKQYFGTYAAGLMLFAYIAAGAGILLKWAQRKWEGTWIGANGCVASLRHQDEEEERFSPKPQAELVS